MTPTLRPFQVDLERSTHAAWDAGANCVMAVAATGSGKTVVLSKLLRDEPGASVAIAHRQELVSQISIALARNGVRHRIIGNKALIRMISGLHINELRQSYVDGNSKTAVGGVDTIIRMNPADPWFKQVRLGVQDEGHHVLKDNKWGKVAAMFPNARWFLPTATPVRADGHGLGRHADGLADALVQAPGMRDIIDMGYLTDYRIFAPKSDVDLSQVPVSSTTGDYNAVKLRGAVHKSHITGDVVAHYIKLASGKLGVTFAVDVAAATEIAAAFRLAGVPAEVISAKTPDALRANIMRRFKARSIMQLVNVDLFGEGVDIPAIEVVSFARPTESFALYSQQFGRALRLMLTQDELFGYDTLSDAGRRGVVSRSDKPTAFIIDHVGNVARHGLPDAYREWSLDAREKRSSKSDAIPTRICINCFRLFERFYTACPGCGAPIPAPTARNGPEQVDGDLHELDAATLTALRGHIARIDGPAVIPYGASPIVVASVKKQHAARQQAQAELRTALAWWGGLELQLGHEVSESYKRFYFTFGVDVATAQALGAREAGELTTRIHNELTKMGVNFEE